MRWGKRGWAVAAALAGVSLGATAWLPAAADSEHLPLGRSGLSERRSVRQVAPGVRYLRIRRGHPSSRDHWTVDVAVTTSRPRARRLRARLRGLGHDAFLRRLDEQAPDDPRRRRVGYRVRVGELTSRGRAEAVAAHIADAGFPDATATHTGLDGDPTTGPWVVHVLDVALGVFDGELRPHLTNNAVRRRHTVTRVATRTGALAAVNGGYFVLEPPDGVVGDPAGVSVLGGELVSEAVGERTSLLLSPGNGVSVAALSARVTAVVDGSRRLVDGVNREPGLVRSCGGVGGDRPTQRPRHDFTCTDPGELVLFTPRFGDATPAGEGAEVVLDAAGHVLRRRDRRGGAIPDDGSVLAGTGPAARWLVTHARGSDVVATETRVSGAGDDGPPAPDGVSVVNGGPRLLRDGETDITAWAEGFVWPGDPSFYDAFGVRRNPRTLAGVTGDGHLLLVAADGGRPRRSLGLSFSESARLMRSLGAVDAVNLDGGGSTTMVIGDELVNRPSDDTGERPVADAVVVLP
ncbi:MAG: phosphodiester glycosidase family protein [Actinobacteria bacterium]|nr:phosphodiester glycosidase family protein [Actinomycetota bacterium]